jgi:hypothetical protein
MEIRDDLYAPTSALGGKSPRYELDKSIGGPSSPLQESTPRYPFVRSVIHSAHTHSLKACGFSFDMFLAFEFDIWTRCDSCQCDLRMAFGIFYFQSWYRIGFPSGRSTVKQVLSVYVILRVLPFSSASYQMAHARLFPAE